MDRELQGLDGQGVEILTMERSGAALLQNSIEQVVGWCLCCLK